MRVRVRVRACSRWSVAAEAQLRAPLVLGIHGQAHDPRMLASSRALVCAQLRKTLGIEFEFINIGGGIGIPYRPGAQCPVPSLAPGHGRVAVRAWG